MEEIPTDLITQAAAAEDVFRIKPQSLRKALIEGRYSEMRRWRLGREVYVSEAEARRVCLQENQL